MDIPRADTLIHQHLDCFHLEVVTKNYKHLFHVFSFLLGKYICGLMRNVLQRLMNLKTWSPIWWCCLRGLWNLDVVGRMSLGRTLMLQSFILLPVLLLCFLPAAEMWPLTFPLCQPPWSHPVEPEARINSFLCKLTLVKVLYHSYRYLTDAEA